MRKSQIERGKIAELLFMAMEIDKGNLPIKVSKDFEIRYDIDFVLLVGGLKEDKTQFSEDDVIYCEVKQDRWINRTKNIVIEICMDRYKNKIKEKREIGWTRKTKADLIYYFNVENPKFTVIECDKLKDYMNKILTNNDMDSKTLGDFDNLPFSVIDNLKFGERVRHSSIRETSVYNEDKSLEGIKYNCYYGADETERDYYRVKKGEIEISSLFEKIQQEYPNVKKGVSLFKRSVIDSVTEWYNKHYGRIVYENEFTLNREEDLNRIKRRAEQNGVRTYS